jgi:hypothetical protein
MAIVKEAPPKAWKGLVYVSVGSIDASCKVPYFIFLRSTGPLGGPAAGAVAPGATLGAPGPIGGAALPGAPGAACPGLATGAPAGACAGGAEPGTDGREPTWAVGGA